ncbi:MAG: MFS transporter [Acidimicrobiia bacterium]|nr:MFS transporter [Acidimicrobiia bacterium]MYC57945.1 MFS transporter [Acidimicrobiia bacterium]MYG94632.1 MFS transporter [Acidimicrobiia bacterium]MYI30822.1 MFS transporter [Acidimicrobiia bacterium]
MVRFSEVPERLLTHQQPLFTLRFVLLCACVLSYFVSLGLVYPVLPGFVKNEFGGGPVAVGLAVGGFGLTAALARPIVGPLGDSLGRRFLVVWGCVFVSLGVLGNLWATSVTVVVLFRLLTGLGEAAFFVGVASAMQDNAPEHRRGEATSYFSVAVYAGLACGPLIGEQIADTVSYDAVWITGGFLCGSATVLGIASVPGRPDDAPTGWPDSLIHWPALRPAALLGFGLMGYSGFLAFIELHVEDIGFARSGFVFVTFAAIVIILRVLLARLPDQLGPQRTSILSYVSSLVGLWVLAFWSQMFGVFVGTVLLAMGQVFLFPALFVMAVESAPVNKRSQAISSFSIAFDLAVGIGGLLLGGVVALSSYSGAFFVGGCLSLLGLLMSRILIRPYVKGAV